MPRFALLSVSDKTGLVDFARQLVDRFQFQIVSSGGTAKQLLEAGIPVTKVAEHTGSPEILGGRVKTLHPRIHGGILARRDREDDQADLAANNIQPFDLVVVNLYPFEATIARPEVTLADAIEQIDIGGPAMVRASAKNHAHLTILTNPSQYEPYLTALVEGEGQVPLAFRQQCALAAFQHTAAYDAAIATYLAEQFEAESDRLQLNAQPVQVLRYGENPHQSATWYQTGATASGWAAAQQLQGKELSYNNLVDLEAARQIIAEFPTEGPAAAAILKHNNPCGVAIASDLSDAYRKAFEADAVSAFGGIVALNRAIDVATAETLTGTFLECIVAPAVEPEAAAILATKKNLRVLTLGDFNSGPQQTVRSIAGGFLVQDSDDHLETIAGWQVVTEQQPSEADWQELLFAWKVVKHVKSNAIAVTANGVTLGIGAGQMNRVGSVKIALEQAGDRAQGAILASDGFFPFDDSVRTAAAAGIRAIVQPGGSLRDADSIAAANELGLVMVFTGTRHFLH
ncbi:bifunctional phosphoribosylaminoimidazolecarboxamide formyltransferase/IMP cyclohydrolase [Synechococcus elongatus IITB7]|uniref:bifunctional phosphoribosylaminoimidazolecarboxamide formyltransferase/IMP cyclohydrolase n=1 Tax=Synechococcus elongatus TaxID=32046 RepID=UPI0030CEC6A7